MFLLHCPFSMKQQLQVFKSYFPERKDISGFLTIFQNLWTVSNSKQQFSPNKLGNAIICDDGKTAFFRQLADWIQHWQ